MYDLATAKARLTIPAGDVTQDTAIEFAMAAALGIAERHCDRKFLYVVGQVDKLFGQTSYIAQLVRYPIVSITSVDLPDSPDVTYDFEPDTGLLYLKAFPFGVTMTVTYDGGYETLPADLELALWLLFDVVWYAGAAGMQAGEQVSSVNIPDVGTINFRTGAGTAALSLLTDPFSLLGAYMRVTS